MLRNTDFGLNNGNKLFFQTRKNLIKMVRVATIKVGDLMALPRKFVKDEALKVGLVWFG